MMTLLLLAGISRCAIADLCPTDAEILSAVRARDDAVVQEVTNQAVAENPDQLVFVHSERIRRISNVICGDRLPGDEPTITCNFTIRYWSRNAYQVAKLVRAGDEWRIEDSLSVTRNRH